MEDIDEIIEAAKHFYVFPVYFIKDKGNVRKIPAIKGWQDKATQDEQEIRKLWKDHPGAKVGAVTGKRAGFVLLDLDRKKDVDGIAVMKEHMKEYGKLPKTLGATSASGGKHRFYKVNKQSDYSTFGVHTDILPINGEVKTGIDTRSTGGYVVIWPTPGYTFQGDLDKMAKVPTWIIDRINSDNKSKGEEKKSAPAMIVSEGQMRADLEKLDPEKFQSRDDWMKIMMMCHSGSDSEDWGRELFTKWSLRDESSFTDDPTEYAARMWSSLTAGKLKGLTYASMKFRVKEAIVAEGFQDFDDDDEDYEVVNESEPEPKPKAKSRSVDPDIEVVDEDNTSLTISGSKADSAWIMTERKKNGKGTGDFTLAKNLTNMVSFLEQEKLPAILGRGKNPLCGLVAYNELKETAVYTRNPPWALLGSRKDSHKGLQIPEEDINEMQIFIAQYWHVEMTPKVVEQAMDTAAVRRKFNPVVDYLESLVWDGKERLETWLYECGRVEKSIYTMAVAKKTLLSMSARALHPGCKVDTAMVLEGDQNIGKSGLLKILGKDWFGAPSIPIGTADAEQNLQGLWVVEWEEYAGGRKAEAEKNKKFLTNNVAHFRGSYGKKSKPWPRRCTISITLNPLGDNTWLNDPTGGRRYWPIEFGIKDPNQIKFKWLEDNVDQLHAEAYSIIKKTSQKDIDTCKPWTMNPEETKEARKIQSERIVKDTLEEDVRDLLYGEDSEWNTRKYVVARALAKEVCGEMEFKRDGTRLQARITTILKNSLKWPARSTRIEGVKSPTKAYHRPLAHEDPNT